MTLTDKEKLEEIKRCLDVYDERELDMDSKEWDNAGWLIGLIRKTLEDKS